MKKKLTHSKKPSSSKSQRKEPPKIPAPVKKLMDPLDFASGTRAITLNLPIGLWEKVDRLVPSRGKNKFFIALLTQFLEEHDNL